MGFLSTIPWVSFHHTTTMGFLSTIPWVSFLPFHGVPFHPTMGDRSTVPLDSIIEYRYHGLPCSAVPVRQLHRTMGFHSTAPWETVVLYNGRPFHMSMLCRFESGSWGSDKLCQILSKFRQCGVVELLPETLSHCEHNSTFDYHKICVTLQSEHLHTYRHFLFLTSTYT